MIVKGQGNRGAKIAIIGEAPGKTEDRVGKPFVGSSGRILDNMLREAGIEREAVWLDNVVQIRPPNNNFASIPKSVVQESIERLVADLDEINPNVIVPLGKQALLALTDKAAISKWRGSIISGRCGKTIPTYHPAYIMRQWAERPLAVLDLTKAKAESSSPNIKELNPQFVMDPDFDMAMELMEKAKDAEYLSFDFETTYSGCPTCIGFSTKVDTAFCIPLMTNGVPHWSTNEELSIWHQISHLMVSPKPKKIAQNVMFDAYVLHSVLNVDLVNFWMDTMLMHNLIYSELPKGLGTLCSIYTKYPYYKDMYHETGTKEDLWKYNCLDACVTLEVALALDKEAKDFGCWNYYDQNVNPLIWPLLAMQSHGVAVDIDMRTAAADKVKSEIDEAQTTLSETVGHDVNVNSPKQIKALLYDELGFPAQYVRGTKKTTVNAKALNALMKKYQHPVIDVILEIRKMRKLWGTYLTSPLDEDGRMRCAYGIAGTETGRLSSRKTIYNTGGNLQNVPKGISRAVVVADPGKIMIQADLSQAEARIVAYVAQDDAMIRIFESEGDAFNKISMMMFGTEANRQRTKKIVHASNYDMGVNTFSVVADISKREARQDLELYHNTFPRIRVWHLQLQNQLRRTRILETPLGRKRIFFGRWGDQLFKEAYAYIPQSTVAAILNAALMNIFYAMPTGVDYLLQIHDEVVIQAPIERADIVQAALARAFDNTLTIHGREVKIPFTSCTGKTWQEVSG